MKEVKKILYAVELSSISPKIVPWVATMVKQFGAELHVLHVVPQMDFWGLPYVSAHLQTMDNQGLAKKALQHVDQFCLDHFGVEMKPVTAATAGEPADEIVKYTKENDIDLVIMGTHGKRGLDRALFGSVADQVLRQTTVPIFCVNPTT